MTQDKTNNVQWAVGSSWTEEQWKNLLESLIQDKLVTWQQVTALVLGGLNPTQVGTSLATTNKKLKENYPPRKIWQAVREWLYNQSGVCKNCGTRLDLQADHIISREQGGADHLDNFQLLCRRCNVIKRPSHKKGGLTFLSTRAALMWLLFVYRPATYQEYHDLCRKYGLTMADIRFQEAWAIAEWLKKEGKYP